MYVLAAILLDLTARYRVRDLFGALVLAGIYALLYGLLLNPTYAFSDMPRTLVTRVTGAHALIAAEMLGLFLALTGGINRRTGRFLLIGSVVVGLAWGIWVRWWPVDERLPQVPLVTMLAYGVGGVVLIGLLLRLSAARTTTLTPDDLRLGRVTWGLLVIALTAALVVRLLDSTVDGGVAFLTLLILVICWAILWFRERSKGRSLLDGHIPVTIPSLSFLLPPLVLFFVLAVAAYNLPLIQIGEANQLTLIGLGFTAYGLAWLPTVSLTLGAQAYLRQLSQHKL